MNGKVVARIIAGLVLLAAILGIAVFAFNAGVAQGVVTKLPAPAAGQTGTVPYPVYGAPFFWHPYPFWGFGLGCFAPLIALLLLFIAFRALRVLFWGARGGWGRPMHGGWHHGWSEEGVPPMFAEMHRRAHAESEKKE